MRFLLLINLFLFLNFNVSAITYYVSSSGNDNNTGQNATSPWKTIDKVNSKMSSFKPGDKILFRRGDTFFGSLQITSSGSSSNNITYGAYGTGELPILAGYKTMSNWTPLAGYPNVWEASYTWSQDKIASLLVNNKLYGMGRYPNLDQEQGGYLIFESFVGKSQITDNELSTAINWTGAEAVIRATRWVLDRTKILSHDVPNHKLNIDESQITANIRKNYGYFIQNHLKTLDRNYEWAYNSSTKKVYIYLANANPNNLNIKISNIQNLIKIYLEDDITIENLSLLVSNEESILIDNSNRIKVRNCKINFAGSNGISILGNSDNNTIENNTIEDVNSTGIYTSYSPKYNLFNNNSLNRIGIIPGLNANSGNTCTGIVAQSIGNTVQYNTIDSTGYNGILFSNINNTIQYNNISYTGLVKNDGGGIYTHSYDYEGVSGCKILNNIILYSDGNPNGTDTPTGRLSAGIYIDGLSGGIEIKGNTVAYASYLGMYLHNSINMNISDNTFYDNRAQVSYINDNASQGRPMRGNIVTNNTFASLNKYQEFNIYSLLNDDIAKIATYNNNYYLNPFSSYQNLRYTSTKDFPNSSPRMTEELVLEQKKARYGIEQGSKSQPINYPTYVVNNLNSTNYVKNPHFNTNSNYWASYTTGESGVANVQRVTNSPMGNALLVTFNSFSGQNRGVGAYSTLESPVSQGKKYLLKFEVASTSSKQSVDVFFRKHGTSYSSLASSVQVPLSSTPKKHELLFVANSSSPNARIDFFVEEQDSLIWIDNVEFYEVNASYTNDNKELMQLFCNTSHTSTTQILDEIYLDKDGVVVANSISIPPCSSVILFKAIDTPDIWFESECAPVIGDKWEFVMDEDASNGSALKVKEGFTSASSPPQNPSDWVRFDFQINQIGNYNIQARIKTPNSSSDSFWVKMDNGNWFKWWENIGFQNFTWSQIPNIYNLSKGNHSLYFAYRESGAMLDKIYLTVKDTTFQGEGELDYTCCPIAGTPCDDSNPFTITDSEDGECNCIGLAIIDTWLEAECPSSLGSLWQVQSDANASENANVAVLTGNNSTSSAPSSNGILTYDFTVAENKNYDIWARIHTPNSQDDSFWIKIDDKNWIAWHTSINGSYTWQKLPFGALNLQPGIHTISIGYREDGAKLDKIVVTSSPSSTPSGMGDQSFNCGNSSQSTMINLPTNTWLEAECATINTFWQINSDSEASNTSYITPKPGYNNYQTPTNENGVINYSFLVTDDNLYDIWARIYTPNSQDDSFWIRIDNQNWIAWHTIINNEYTWQKLPLGVLNLPAGSHTISFSYREDGARLDKVVALLSSSNTPEEMGEEANNCVSQKQSSTKLISINTSNIPQELGIQASPNPVVDYVRISFETTKIGEENNNELRLYNSKGVLIQTWSRLSYKGKIDIDFSKLPSGIYIFKITTQGTEYQAKVMKL